MNNILITGATGFAGSHLADLCIAKEQKVYGTVRWRSNRDNIRHLSGYMDLVECDVRDLVAVRNAIEKSKPNIIFHLAAQSLVPTSWIQPYDTIQSNVDGTLNVLEAVRSLCKHSRSPVILITGSSEEYGAVRTDEIPICEENQLRPLSPYAVSKVAQDLLGYQYFKSYGLQVVRTRAFNHSGARRSPDFVLSGFVRDLVGQFSEGKRDAFELQHGNLSAIREFTNVKDIVKGYYALAEAALNGSPYVIGDVFNVCCGVGWKISEALQTIWKVFKACTRLHDATLVAGVDKNRLRPSDVPVLVGSPSKIKQAVEWKLQREDQLVWIANDLVEYWSRMLL